MNDIIDLAQAREQKKEKERQASLKNLPPQYVEYVQSREIQIASMKKLTAEIEYFEKEILTFSKNRKLSGPVIDHYLLNKVTLDYALESLRVSDAKVKEFYPFADLSPISL